jgi:UPF0755 protein
MKNYFKKNKKKALFIFLGVSGFALIATTYLFINTSLNPNRKDFSIYIPTDNKGQDIEKAILDSLCQNSDAPSSIYLKWKITAFFKSPEKFPPGRYKLGGKLSARKIFNKINNGNQDAISFRIDNIKTIYSLAKQFEKKFEQDSAHFIAYVNQNLDLLTPNTQGLPFEVRQQRVLERLLGDTYEMYWTTTPENFFSRLNTIYDQYWTYEQDNLASRIGLSEHEVYVLASIVRGETANEEEAPLIAGLYLNRLKQGMLLQSDPTVLFGINSKEKRQRVRHSDLKYDSPYNTYLYKGLPPATIHIVEKRYLNAVLNAATHNYIFMCAQPRGSGKHNFAITYEEHKANARKYQSYLDSIDINR